MEPTHISDLPTSVLFDFASGAFEPFLQYTQRKVSDLHEMFADQQAVAEIMQNGDRLVYDIRYHPFRTSNSDMALGVTRIQPGTIGGEYHMTKGHFHEREDQPEIYFCVHGTGYLLMETRDGQFQAAPWKPGAITHIPGMWAHRVVNTGSDELFFVASYHLAAGHIYAPVVERGFAQIVVEQNGQPVFLPNPRRV